MLGLLGTLEMASRTMQAHRQGTEVAGHNLANVNNPNYARQRVSHSAADPLNTIHGSVGTGVAVTGVQQIRDARVDRQLQIESSIRSSLETQKQALEFAESGLGEKVDYQSREAAGTSESANVGTSLGFSEYFSEFFNAIQSVASNSTSVAERQKLIHKAENLSAYFQRVDERLTNLELSLNEEIQDAAAAANEILSNLAKLNKEIVSAETVGRAKANDLRDIRQHKLEELAKFVQMNSSEEANGSVTVNVDGTTLVSGTSVVESFVAFDDGSGALQIQEAAGGRLFNITSGVIHGKMVARDEAVRPLRATLNEMAASLISEVNSIHRTGYGLDSTTGEDFFVGSGAADIEVNAFLAEGPARIQASATANTPGNNEIAVQLAQLANIRLPALSDQSFSERYTQAVTNLGQEIQATEFQLTNQELVEGMLQRQRQAVSGVSIDEEMTDLVRYQRAFEASAKVLVTVDELLMTVLDMKR